MAMLFPTLRGGNDNPGQREYFWGEVQDVAAAILQAAQLPYVDPARIYLGGHSTGATLALLTATAGLPVQGCSLWSGGRGQWLWLACEMGSDLAG